MLELPELEQRLSNLQSQVERLWRKAESNVPPIEQRLAAMADQYAEYLKRWAATVERHTHAVAQLEEYASEWKDASSRVRQETADRLHELETTIEREWETLKKMQEEPIRELREQADSLTQVSLAMASASQQGMERAEARFAAFETEVHLRLNELTRELTTAVAEMRARQGAPRDPSAQWSLDDVTRLHGQLREGTQPIDQFPHTIEHSSIPETPKELPAPAVSESSADDEPEPVAISDHAVAEPRPMRHDAIPVKWLGAGAVALVVLLMGVFGWRLQSQITTANERALIAQQKADAALSDAARQTALAQETAARQIDETRQVLMRTQRIGNISSAPDLIRFNLAGINGASGQALFSRSRGLSVSAFRMPAPPQNGAHQVWLLTPNEPIKVGVLERDGDQSFTLVQELPNIPRRVVGVMVTQEPGVAGAAPLGAAVLSSISPQQSGGEEP